MKRTIVTATVLGLALGGAGLASAKPSKGAQKSSLVAASGLVPLTCQSGPAGTGKQTALGFVVLNAPGRPGAPRKIVGQVSVKSAAEGVYDVLLASGTNGSCGTKVATLTVDHQGHGSAAIASPTAQAGSYYIVLSQVLGNGVPVSPESYASAPVVLN